MQDNQAREEELTQHWFKDNEVSYYSGIVILPDGVELERLIWRKPKTTCYYTQYLRVGQYLMVTGDIGEATYWWTETNNLQWMSQLDLGYFSSKCTASETGRGYHEWDQDLAVHKLKATVTDIAEGLPGTCEANTKRLMHELHEYCAFSCLSCAEEWNGWCVENASNVFGSDWREQLGGLGDRINLRCQGHLLGLKMVNALGTFDHEADPVAALHDLTPEQATLRAQILAAGANASEASSAFRDLMRRCAALGHVMVCEGLSARCIVCNKFGGWWCPTSPTKECEYTQEDGSFDDDNCRYCHKPEERK